MSGMTPYRVLPTPTTLARKEEVLMAGLKLVAAQTTVDRNQGASDVAGEV